MMACLKISLLAVLAVMVLSQTTSAQTLQGVVSGVNAALAGQTCRWVGTSPFCSVSCDAGENEVEKSACGDGACCWSGYKLRCCKPIVQPVIVQSKN